MVSLFKKWSLSLFGIIYIYFLICIISRVFNVKGFCLELTQAWWLLQLLLTVKLLKLTDDFVVTKGFQHEHDNLRIKIQFESNYHIQLGR